MAGFNDLQQRWLSEALDEKLRINVYLNKGLMVQGTVFEFDNFTVAILNGEDQLQLFNKSAISSFEFPLKWRPAKVAEPKVPEKK